MVPSLLAVAFTMAIFLIAFTRYRIIILCAFYICYGLLTVLNNGGTPLLGGFKAYRLVYPVLFLSVIVRGLGDHDFGKRIRHWPLISYCAVLLVLLLSSFYSPSNSVFSVENTAGLFDRAFVVSLFWLAASQIQRESDLTIFAVTTGVVSVVLAGWVLWNAATLDFSAYRGGTSVNENYLSMILFTGVAPLVYCLFTDVGRIGKLTALLLLLVVIAASLILASRGILFAGATAVLVIVLSASLSRGIGHWKMSMVLVSIATLIVVVVLVLPGADNILARLESADLSTFNGRTAIWSYSWKCFLDSNAFEIVFGRGLASTPHFLTPAIPEFENLHNTYLLWLMEQGVVGLLVFASFLFAAGRSVLQSRHPQKAVMFGWLVLLLLGGLSGTVSDDHGFWVLLGVVAGASSFRPEDTDFCVELSGMPEPLSPLQILCD